MPPTLTRLPSICAWAESTRTHLGRTTPEQRTTSATTPMRSSCQCGSTEYSSSKTTGLRSSVTTSTQLGIDERDVVVVERRTASDCVIVLTLQAATGEALPLWDPGAHIDVLLPNGLIRQYSLTGDAGQDGRWRIGVLRETDGRGGSAWIHDNVDTGTVLRIRGPRNNFELSPSRRYLLIAGGVGITPLLAMAATLEARGAQWRMVYGGRSRRSMAFLDELSSYGNKVQIVPEDECGLLDLAATLDVPASDTLVYCCGPSGLIDAVESRCASWPSEALRVERFSGAEQINGGMVDQPVEVELRRSGLTLQVPAGQSILAAVEEAGIDALYSCREGTCGSCEASVLAGEIDHRDHVLSQEEREANDTMMICVSRGLTNRIVLDL